MSIRIIGKIYVVVCAALFAGPAVAKGTFEIGPQIGYSNFEDIDGLALGLIARYTAPINNTDMFFGLQAGFAHEFSSDQETIGFVDIVGTLNEKASVNWSFDILPRIGYDFGKVSVELATGLSFIQGEAALSGSVLGYSVFSVSDTNWHTGWKIAPGINYELTENVSLMGQFHYAWYSTESYTATIVGVPVSIDANTNLWGTYFGVLYKF